MDDKSLIALIVEDEQHIADLLDTNLSLDGYETIVCELGKDALAIVENRHVDIILLDVMLPDGKGTDICRSIKHKREDIPILMLSALGQSSDRIKGLKSGADDYLPKPFELEELTLRMSNLLERFGKRHQVDGIIKIGEADIDMDQFTLSKGNETYKLSSKEALLMKFMIECNGQTISRQQILDEVWGYEHYPSTRTIDNFISNFRKYIEVNPKEPKIITTVRGIGYRMNHLMSK